MPSKNAEIGVFILVTTGLILLLIGFIILILFLYKRKQANHYRDLEMQKIDYDKKLLATQLEMQEQTLKHISREIHDNISSLLGLARLNLKNIHWQDEADIRHKVSSSAEQLQRATEDLRYLSKTLNGDTIAQFGLLPAIERELEYIGRLKILETGLELEGEPIYLKDEKELIIFRIIQEALNNSIKHAKSATRLLVKLHFTSEHLLIMVCDDGKSWTESDGRDSHKNGIGLKNMKQRSHMLNGSFHIDHIPLQGTTISITVPLKA